MGETAISAHGLGKRYRLGVPKGYRTVRESLVSAFTNARDRVGRRSVERPVEDALLWALREVDFEVKRGDVVGIIGRNGAGKSTLLKILSKITKPTEGCVEITGRVGSLLEVGTGFHPELTASENIFLNGAILGMSRAEVARQFDEIVAFAEVERFLDTPVKRFSSGMYSRLAFAVAAHLEPDILVIDEVLAVGDAEFQRRCLGKMSDVAKSGRTVLFVSHHMNAIERVCKSAMLLHGGRLVRHGHDVRSIINNYLYGEETSRTQPSEWIRDADSPSNSHFTAMAMRLTDHQGRPVPASVRNDEEVWIEIDCNIESFDPALTIGYALYSEEGQTVYWSYHTDSRESQWPKLKVGRQRIRSRVPEHFLNEGTYRIELIGGLHCRQWLYEPGKTPAQIFLTIQGGLSESPYWQIRRPGLAGPVIQWEVDALPH